MFLQDCVKFGSDLVGNKPFPFLGKRDLSSMENGDKKNLNWDPVNVSNIKKKAHQEL